MREPNFDSIEPRVDKKQKDSDVGIKSDEKKLLEIKEDFSVGKIDRLGLWLSKHKGQMGTGLTVAGEAVKEARPMIGWGLQLLGNTLNKNKKALNQVKESSFWQWLLEWIKSIINNLKG